MGLYEGPQLREGKTFRLPNGMRVEFVGQRKLILSSGGRKVELDVRELRMFLRAAKRHWRVSA